MSKDRPYLQSHTWLTFETQFTHFSPLLWIKLGEAQSWCDCIAGAPLLPEVAKYLHKRYLAKGAMATTAIEGNTLTESQVLQQLEGHLKLPPSKEYLGREVQNIIDACNIVSDAIIAHTYPESFDVGMIRAINAQVLKDLEVESGVFAGQIRKHSVVVGRYRGAPAEDCKYLLEKLCESLNKYTVDGYPPIAIGLLRAIFAHLYIAWIHPF